MTAPARADQGRQARVVPSIDVLFIDQLDQLALGEHDIGQVEPRELDLLRQWRVHAAMGGQVLLYRDLVKYLDPALPVYGLQAAGLNGERPVHTRVEEMAAHYVEAITAHQPAGPYYLLGYCVGGTLAF